MLLSGGSNPSRALLDKSINSRAVSLGSQVSIEPVTAHTGMLLQDR